MSDGPIYLARVTCLTRSSERCERCNGSLFGVYGYSLHHRRPRGMGGSRDPRTNRVPNFLVLCGSGTTGCHGWVEQNRARAYDTGFLVRRGHDPEHTPIVGYQGLQTPIWLCDDGHYHPSPTWEHP